MQRQAIDDLRGFKEFIESRVVDTAAGTGAGLARGADRPGRATAPADAPLLFVRPDRGQTGGVRFSGIIDTKGGAVAWESSRGS